MTRARVETLLSRLARYDEAGDDEGGALMIRKADGEFVYFDDVQRMLWGLVDPRQSE